MAETKHGLAGACVGIEFVDTSAFLAGGGVAGVEDEAVAEFGRSDEFEGDVVGTDAGYLAEKHAAFGAEATVGELLIVDAIEPARVETAGEGHV